MNVLKINNNLTLNIYASAGYIHASAHIIDICVLRELYFFFLIDDIKWISLGIIFFLAALVIEILFRRKIDFSFNSEYSANHSVKIYFWLGVVLNTLIMLFVFSFFVSERETPLQIISASFEKFYDAFLQMIL